ncbi:MAG: hypothetical protein QG657_5507 [Acidobacteriota bacterium]|nr:hypothetical protein [Acidobacteriota bacterium]
MDKKKREKEGTGQQKIISLSVGAGLRVCPIRPIPG